MKRQRVCKDCGSFEVIHKHTDEKYLDDVQTMLCSPCLHSRAQLQRIREDKLPFEKLIAKIQSETAKRVSSEIASVSGVERLQWGRYKGENSYTTLSSYWVDQLTQG